MADDTLTELQRADKHNDELVSLAIRLAGTPCSPLYKRHSFPDDEWAALVAMHLPEWVDQFAGPASWGLPFSASALARTGSEVV